MYMYMYIQVVHVIKEVASFGQIVGVTHTCTCKWMHAWTAADQQANRTWVVIDSYCKAV